MNTKEHVMYILEKEQGRDVSGQEIADALQISRTAVWKVIQTLQEDGFPIISTPRKGYRLNTMNARLSAGAIRSYLTDTYQDGSIEVYECVDSTNTRMKEAVTLGAKNHSILVANTQSQGKGRYGRIFYSPKESGIYMTLLLREHKTIQDATYITMIAGVAVCHIIEKLTNIKPSIKWVNDIFCNQRKVAGILSEAVIDFESGMSEAIILGIGLNILKMDFPSELQLVASSLQETSCNRNQWIGEIANAVFTMYENQDLSFILEEYRRYSCVLHKQVNFTWNNTLCTGYVKAINDQGNLVIEMDGKQHILSSGEISIKL